MKEIVRIFDNIIPPLNQNHLEDKILISPDDLDWKFVPETTSKEHLEVWENTSYSNKIRDTFQFVHGVIFDDRVVQSPMLWDINQIFTNIRERNGFCYNFDILRVKINLQTNSLSFDEEKINPPHVDIFDNLNQLWTIIYYINDSDGDTFIFNERRQREEENYPNKLTLNTRVTPKKGTCVMFPTSHIHAGSSPIKSQFRAVINCNIRIY